MEVAVLLHSLNCFCASLIPVLVKSHHEQHFANIILHLHWEEVTGFFSNKNHWSRCEGPCFARCLSTWGCNYALKLRPQITPLNHPENDTRQPRHSPKNYLWSHSVNPFPSPSCLYCLLHWMINMIWHKWQCDVGETPSRVRESADGDRVTLSKSCNSMLLPQNPVSMRCPDDWEPTPWEHMP